MIPFLNPRDELSKILNEACNTLMLKIQHLELDTIEIEPFFKEYFIKCHFTRQVFSLKTSAYLLYNAIIATDKHYKDLVVMDYGAGLGTLYLLAKMIGVKKIIYNDMMPEFVSAARAIDIALGYPMDEYIQGDTLSTCQQLQKKNIHCDIVTSRNVVEHIYSLATFFKTMHDYQAQAILYNSTTANWKNPATHLQHIFIHKKYVSRVFDIKLKRIKEEIPEIHDKEAKALATVLTQYGGDEYIQAIQDYKVSKKMPVRKNDYTNFCEENGNWAEHLIPYHAYRAFAPQYHITFKPGFWDEHYDHIVKRTLGKLLNRVTSLLGEKGVFTASFIYIIALPKKL